MPNLLCIPKGFSQAITLVTVVFFSGFVQAQSVIYVDQASTGNGDGSTWVDAFITLEDALTASSSGDEIWIAQGIYLPGDTIHSRYVLANDIRIYGGFSGAETQLSERDPVLYPTILSGDVLGDDFPSNTQDNRWDNLYTILEVKASITSATILDGLIFRGGHAVGDNFFLTNAWGGAIFCEGAPQIRGCRFTDNFADKRGGAIYIQSDHANGLQIEDCHFEGNSSNEDGGAVFVNQTDGSGIFIDNCTYNLNKCERRGGAIAVYNASSQVTGCSFNNNIARQAGGAVQVQASFNFLRNGIDSCTFIYNQATRGGAVHMVSSSVFGSVGNEFEVTRSSFNLNESFDFTNNSNDAVRGGAIFLESNVNASETKATISNCTFSDNYSDGDAGLAHVQFDGQESSLVFQGNLASKNLSKMAGPLTISIKELGEANILIDSCLFSENHAVMGAAGIIIQIRDHTHFDLLMNKCRIEKGNANEVSGLSINASGLANVKGQFRDCVWNENVGKSCFSVNDETDKMELLFQNVELNGNASSGTSIISFTGAGSNIEGMPSVRFENALMYNHSGADHLLFLEKFRAVVLNITLAENELPALFLGDGAVVELQNSILANLGEQELVGVGAGSSILSHGGNIIDDPSFSGWLGTLDMETVDPEFLTSTELTLSSISPGIDFGTLPASIFPLDLAGNARIQGNGIDAGAYESPFTSAVSGSIAAAVRLEIWPNPATEALFISLNEGYEGHADIRILDAEGRLVKEIPEGLKPGQTGCPVSLSGLAPGVFTVQVSTGDGIRAVGSFVVIPSN